LILNAVQILITRKFIILFNIFHFCINYFLFGPHTAINSLRKYSKYSIIPILRLFHAKIGNNCDIESGITIHNCKNFKNLSIGNNCHIGKDCFFDLRDKIIIDDNVVISMRSIFITHIDMSKSEFTKLFPPKSKDISIRRNCYIGVNSTVLMGVTLNEFAFIAANSLVREDVQPYTMVGGVPAKFIKKIEIENGKN
jgi:acetyltransferase-like isoleucine patch superfamily enzyme